MTGPQPQAVTATVMVAFHFAPSPEVGARRMSALARYLTERGQQVTVVSAFEGLEAVATDTRRAELRGYELIHVPVQPGSVIAWLVQIKRRLRRSRAVSPTAEAATPQSQQAEAPVRSQHSPLGRLLMDVVHVIDDRKRWSWQAARRIISATRPSRPTVMVVSGPPLSPLLAAVVCARRLRLPVIVDLRDPIYLETEQRAADHRPQRQWGRRALERYVLRHAAHITTTSPSLRSLLQARHPGTADRISCVYNGFDGDLLPGRAATRHRLIMVYAGALYLNRNPFPFLEAVGDLLGQPGIDASCVEVIFAGECEEYRGVSLRGWLSGRATGKAVTILPKLGAADLRALYERATLLLNFAEGQPMQVPAKTFELLALGRELLVLCEPQSDTAALVAGLAGVTCVQSDQMVAMRALLMDVYRRHVVEGTLRSPLPEEVSRYSRAAQNERFAELIDAVRRTAPHA